MGATFGGSSQTVFGSGGPLPLMNKVTTGSAIIFMLTSISLAYLSAHMSTNSLMKNVPVSKPISSTIERAPAKEVEQPDIVLDKDNPAENVKDNVGSAEIPPAEVLEQKNITVPPVVEHKATEALKKNAAAVDKAADKVIGGKTKQPVASEFDQQPITEQEEKK